MYTKYDRYQDYVISDGELVGEFEEMYQDHSDPWEQTTRETFASEKIIALNYCKKLDSEKGGDLRVIELGCGLGHYSNQLQEAGFNVLGTDISPTAIVKARNNFPNCKFEAGDILDFHIYEAFSPDVFIMAEITWYVLEKLGDFLTHLRENYSHAYLIHLLNTYPDGTQRYGKEYFTNLNEILRWFGLNYIEYGSVTCVERHNCTRTYFISSLKT